MIKEIPVDERKRLQQALPDAARATLADRAAKLAEREAAAEAQIRAERELCARWRHEFEAAVAAELVRLGAEWLAEYRVPDHEAPGLPKWSRARLDYPAMFDLAAVGGLVLTLDMHARHDVWVPASVYPWTVHAACGAGDHFSNYPDALAAALETQPPF